MKTVFLDTETTGLHPGRRAWDVALIVVENGTETEHQWFVASEDIDLGNADLAALNIGRFYERHPEFNGAPLYGEDDDYSQRPESEYAVLLEVEQLTRGATIIGVTPSFDTETLAPRMRANSMCPSWHYRLVDVIPMIVGYLRYGDRTPPLPWKSEELSHMVGVDPPAAAERHTALGDARWVKRIWDTLMSGSG